VQIIEYKYWKSLNFAGEQIYTIVKSATVLFFEHSFINLDIKAYQQKRNTKYNTHIHVL